MFMGVRRRGSKGRVSPWLTNADLVSRRQFAITDRPLEDLAAWNRTALRCGMSVQAHPELEVTQLSTATRTVTMIGYAVDPSRPSATNEDIVAALLSEIDSLDRSFYPTARLVGRWVVVVEDDDGGVLFHDPCGLRQVHHSIASARTPRFCTSQPGLVKRELGLRRDERAMEEFARSDYARLDEEYWWPYDSTPFRDVRCLIPNHYLDLTDWSVHRFWPTAPPAPIALDEAVEFGSSLLTSALQALGERFPLSLPLTAGRDSRTLLAASRDLAPTIHFFTLSIPNASDNRTDIRVAASLLARLGLVHHVVPVMRRVHKDFLDAYRQSVEPAHLSAALLAESMAGTCPPDRVALMGHASEIVRNFYRFRVGADQEDLAHLLEKVHMTGNGFAEEHFRAWMADVAPAIDLGYDLWDLLYWEQRDGRWAANGQAQWDVVFESATPFNCRLLLETLLGVASEQRGHPAFDLHQQMMQAMWPEVLNEPLNPFVGRSDMVRALADDMVHDPRRAWRRIKPKLVARWSRS